MLPYHYVEILFCIIICIFQPIRNTNDEKSALPIDDICNSFSYRPSKSEKREVTLKFMKNKESFHNEVSIRLESKFDSRCVMDMFDSFDYDNDKSSRNVSM